MNNFIQKGMITFMSGINEIKLIKTVQELSRAKF